VHDHIVNIAHIYVPNFGAGHFVAPKIMSGIMHTVLLINWNTIGHTIWSEIWCLTNQPVSPRVKRPEK
jgi:hypothetical protein